MRPILAHAHMLLLNCFVRKNWLPVMVRQHCPEDPFAFLLLCSAPAMYANQGNSVTLNEKNASLETVMKKIEQQTEYRFWFEKKLLQNANKVDIKVSNVSLKTALDIAFENQPLSYQLVEKTIVVKKKSPAPQPAESQQLLAVSTTASRENITGVVRNKKGEPLVGASVRVRGTNQGVSTNERGEFSLINVASNAVLEISMTGYKPYQVRFTGSNTRIEISLEQEPITMGDVVVTGYQSKNRSEYAGAAQTVKTKDIKVVSLGTWIRCCRTGCWCCCSEHIRHIRYRTQDQDQGQCFLSGINEPLWVLDNVPLEAPLNIVPSEPLRW